MSAAARLSTSSSYGLAIAVKSDVLVYRDGTVVRLNVSHVDAEAIHNNNSVISFSCRNSISNCLVVSAANSRLRLSRVSNNISVAINRQRLVRREIIRNCFFVSKVTTRNYGQARIIAVSSN